MGAARDTAPAPRACARSRAQRARALQELGPPLLLGAPQQPVPVRAHAGRAGAALVDVEGEAAGHVPGLQAMLRELGLGLGLGLGLE